MSERPDCLSSTKVRAGHRTYFLDLERHGESGVCLSINESKRVAENDFERHRIMVDKQYLPSFYLALGKLLGEAKLLEAPTPEETRPHSMGKWSGRSD